jgi:uncharacterized protein (DUF924 family)
MKIYLLLVTSIFNFCACFAEDSRIHEILTYWFGELQTPEDYPSEKSNIWFAGGPQIDQEIRSLFEPLVWKAANHDLDNWKESAKGRLALIILLDQFPRNIFRGQPNAFAFDPMALELTLEGLCSGVDQQLFPIERVFFYLPLEHAENIKYQELSIAKFEELAKSMKLPLKSVFESFSNYAHGHYRIIEKFGRFPHRNAILGRETTSEEEAFLKTPNSSY